MSCFLVTGANGFVGRHLVAALARRGFDVKQAVRRLQPVPETAGETHAVGDIGPGTDWDSALERVDVVVHLAARVHCLGKEATDAANVYKTTNVLGTERLARRAAARGVRRLIYLSSIGVHGSHSGAGVFTECDPPAPCDVYTLSKWEAEKALHAVSGETGLEIVILRPPLVYGPGNPGNFMRLLELVASGWPLPLGALENRRSLLFVGNLADAIIRCATHAAAAGETYLVSDGRDISTSDLIRRLAARMGRGSRLFPFPPLLLRNLAKLAGRSADIDRIMNSLRVDDSKIRTMLGWQPPFSLEEGLSKTVSWFVADRASRSTR